MGTRPRLRQERLAGKLRQIRDALDLSQSEMLRRLGVEDLIDAYRISEFETGKREPPLLVLLRYAEVAGICTDVLIDDDKDLPTRLPGKPKHSRR
jgi:transcriptional regulator with XRE-family HTH domain